MLGFSLAEVLITLTIIGVVASISLPSLIQYIQDTQLKIAYKSVYAELDNATRRVVSDQGGSIKSSFPDYPDLASSYAKYLIYTKQCTSSSSEGCWHKAGKWSSLSGDPDGDSNVGISSGATTPGFILNNGTLLYFSSLDGNCTNKFGYTDYYYCARIDVDVNGFKGPNKIGKDIFGMYIREDGIKPLGITGDWTLFSDCIQPPKANWNAYNNSGYGCSAQYLQQ